MGSDWMSELLMHLELCLWWHIDEDNSAFPRHPPTPLFWLFQCDCDEIKGRKKRQQTQVELWMTQCVEVDTEGKLTACLKFSKSKCSSSKATNNLKKLHSSHKMRIKLQNVHKEAVRTRKVTDWSKPVEIQSLFLLMAVQKASKWPSS